MNEERRKREALFRYAVLGELLNRVLGRGELGRGLRERAAKVWTGPDGRERRIAEKTLQEWYYRYKHDGFDGLLPAARRDRGKTRVIRAEIEELILAMKREDPGRSAALIHRQLELNGRLRRGEVSASAIRRLLRREGLSGPRMEVEHRVRLRWQASRCGELWRGNALHGPSLFDPASGRLVRVKIFALLNDRSRLVPYVRAGFHETQVAFLTVLLGAILRRGIPRAILLDNHKSFTGSDVAVASAKLGVRLVFARPHDGPAKGKIERWWRTLRAHVLGRLDLEKVTTLDELNVRLSSWVEAEYNTRPRSSLGGKTPLEVWEEDAEEIRWVDDPAQVEEAFTDKLKRQVRADSTCQVRGRTLEVPPELRGRSVEIHYSLLHPDRLWIEDGRTRVPIREVDPEANAHRARQRKPLEKKEEPPTTGLNPVEEILRRLTHRRKDREMVNKVLSRFALTKNPFTKDVPVDELFEHESSEAALTRLKAAVEGRSSAVLTGEPGTGKTFVLRALEEKLSQSRYRLTYIHNSHVNSRDFYRQLSVVLGIEPKATSEALFRMISRHLEETAIAKVHPILMFDEAQLLPIRVLEQLPVLLNFQKDSKPFLSVVLIGLPELRERLRRNVLCSLAARLPVRVQLDPLNAQDVTAYLQHRLRAAGSTKEVFAEDAVLLIAEATAGTLRRIDVLAAHTLEVASEGKSAIVNAAVVEKAVKQCAEALS